MRITIGKKILLIVGTLTLLMAISGVVGIVSIGRVGENADIIMDEAEIIDSIQEARVSFQQLLMPPNDYLITGDAEEQDNFEKLLSATKNSLSRYAKLIEGHEHYTKPKIDEKTLLADIGKDLAAIEQLSRQIFSMANPLRRNSGKMMEGMDTAAYGVSEELGRLASLVRKLGSPELTDSIHELDLAFHQLLMSANDYLITADKNEITRFDELLTETKEKLASVSDLFVKYKGSIAHPGDKGILEGVEKDLAKIESLARKILAVSDPQRVEGSQKMEQMDAVADKATETLGELAREANDSGRHDFADVAQRLRISFQKLLMPANDYLIHGNKEEKKNFEELFASIKEDLAGTIKLATTQKEKEILGRIDKELAMVVSISREILSVSDPIGVESAKKMEEMDTIANHVVNDLHVLLNDAENDIRGAMEVADSTEVVSKTFAIAALAMIIVGGLAVSIAISRPMVRSVRVLVAGTQKVAGGDLAHQVTVKSNDELAQLADSFNHMTNEIQKRNEEVQTMNEELRSTNEELESSNEELQSTTEELEASNEELNNTTLELRGANKEIRGLNENLEKKVDERTEELMATNEELRSTTEELEASNEELRTTNEELGQTQEKLVQQEKLAAVGQLASGVGHELRNPLGVIKNAAYYIRTKVGEDDPKLLKHLGIMEREINNSNKIISDLLGFSRTRSPAIVPFDVNRIVEECLEVVEIPENVLVAKELAPELSKTLADPDQIRQVFVNLSLNATQAMTEGGQLKVVTRSQGDFIEVEFSDTGCGVPTENLDKLFDPFFSTKARGVGLGLAVTHGIIERNSGSIEVKSEVGAGTTFLIRLPSQEPTHSAATTDEQEIAVS